MLQILIGLPQVFSMVLHYHSLDYISYFVKKMNIEKILKNTLLEYSKKEVVISENLKYHLDNELNLTENIFRPHSKKFFDLINEVRYLYDNGHMELSDEEIELVESDLGTKITLKGGKEVYLDIPMSDEFINEAEYKGKKVEIGKPRRNTSGGKKYVVYVKNPSTGKVKKISFGDVKGGLTAKVSNPKARKAFASRHQCDKKKDRMTAGYWACRLNRFGHLWGGKTYPGFW